MKLRAERRLRFRLVFPTCASENTCASVKVDGAAVGRKFEGPLPLAIMLGEPAFLAVIVGDMGHRDRRVSAKSLASFAAARGPIMPSLSAKSISSTKGPSGRAAQTCSAVMWSTSGASASRQRPNPVDD